MANRDDGGPAFARPFSVEQPHFTGNAEAQAGMSLRDWYAGQAMAAAGGMPVSAPPENADEFRSFVMAWARTCYICADAMLAERNRDGA